MTSAVRNAQPSKVPETNSQWWALKFPDFSLEHEVIDENECMLTLFRTKHVAEDARNAYKAEHSPPWPTVVSIVIT